MISSHTENPQLLGTLQNKKIYPYISGDTPLGVVFGDLLGTIPKTRQNRLFSFCIFRGHFYKAFLQISFALTSHQTNTTNMAISCLCPLSVIPNSVLVAFFKFKYFTNILTKQRSFSHVVNSFKL